MCTRKNISVGLCINQKNAQAFVCHFVDKIDCQIVRQCYTEQHHEIIIFEHWNLNTNYIKFSLKNHLIYECMSLVFCRKKKKVSKVH